MDYSLVIAAAQAAGPCPPGEEASWGRRVQTLTVEQEETDRGRQLIERARSLVGRWVLVYRYNEEKSRNRQHNVRMLAHIVDLGDGAISVNMAKKVLLDDVGGVVARAQGAWESTGLPDTGTVGVEQLQRARAELMQ
ncbi:hypothetical protein ACYCCF_29870 [Streptomyces argenteolus]|uniref:hypothetical protein n=1 Tax=Streptomyces sp. NPDC025273 TaxID=3155251 RepID=UPI0033F4D299